MSRSVAHTYLSTGAWTLSQKMVAESSVTWSVTRLIGLSLTVKGIGCHSQAVLPPVTLVPLQFLPFSCRISGQTLIGPTNLKSDKV